MFVDIQPADELWREQYGDDANLVKVMEDGHFGLLILSRDNARILQAARALYAAVAAEYDMMTPAAEADALARHALELAEGEPRPLPRKREPAEERSLDEIMRAARDVLGSKKPIASSLVLGPSEIQKFAAVIMAYKPAEKRGPEVDALLWMAEHLMGSSVAMTMREWLAEYRATGNLVVRDADGTVKESLTVGEERVALTDGRCPACGRDRLVEPSGWTLCDYGNEATLPEMGELVELAVVNNGKMARTFGGRVACDEAWAWASAEPQLLWAGLPVGLDDLFEWDEGEARTVYWRKLAPLPPPPTDLPNGQNGA